MAGLLTSDAPLLGATKLSSWLNNNADILGRSYVSELRRDFLR